MASGAQRFYISETNPNDAIGGGGCLCSEGRCEDREGPYAVFYVTETDSHNSPHVVICAPCARGVVTAVDTGVECIHAGEPAVDVHDAELIEVHVPERHENPVAEGEYPDLDADDELAI